MSSGQPAQISVTPPKTDFDPDEFRMSIGDHLEELRHRILLGLGGLVVSAAICLIFGKHFISFLATPLLQALQRNGNSTELFVHELTEGFMVYIRISMICAVALASPWIIYQLWQFVAAGLYPRERKYVTKYVPLSLILLISGMLFVYFLVLPMTLQFFLSFTNTMDMPSLSQPQHPSVPTTLPSFLQVLPGNPPHPTNGQQWIDSTQNRIKVFINGEIRVVPFGADNLIGAQFTLSDYLDLVVQLLLTFGLAFQLPLVVMALARIGIVDIPALKSFRRFVYLGMTILAAFLSPGDVVTATIALMIPLILLYEFGIFLAVLGEKRAKAESQNAG